MPVISPSHHRKIYVTPIIKIRNAQYLSESTSFASMFSQIDRILVARIFAGIKIKKQNKARNTSNTNAMPKSMGF